MISFKWFFLYFLLGMFIIALFIDVLTMATVQTVYITDTVELWDTVYRSPGEYHDGEFYPNAE